MKAALVLQLSGAMLSLVKLANPELIWIPPFLAGVLFGLSLILSFILKSKKYERTWYGGRAAAESVKTNAWRYAICGEPYAQALTGEDADEMFLKNMKAIIDQKKDLSAGTVVEFPAGPQITEWMRETRKLPTVQRLKVYLADRIAQQREWYSRKAIDNQRSVEKYFWAFIAAQTGAMVFAFFRIKFPEMVNLASFASAIAASLLAWSQIKKHQEISQSYLIAAHELSLVSERGRHVATDAALAVFVGDAETAISREHTLWVARRDAPT